jgi:hypothetical protein
MTQHDPRHDRLVEQVRDALSDEGPAPDRLAAMRARVDRASVRGGTTLRQGHRAGRLWAGGAVLAAAALVLVAVLGPMVDRSTTVSAATILGRSRAALAAPGAGVEVLTYDLSVDGVLADLLPAEQSGRFTVEETIDHDHAGRYRLLKLAPGGDVVFGVADDALRGTRARYLRANGRGYLLRFTSAAPAPISLLAVKRSALQALITLMQASTNPSLRDTTCDGEPCYEITIPQEVRAPEALVSLESGRALVTAADARLVEFSAAGRFAERPFGVEFTLRGRTVRDSATVAPGTFELAPRPGDIVLEGNASSNPMWDVVERTLAAIPREPGR